MKPSLEIGHRVGDRHFERQSARPYLRQTNTKPGGVLVGRKERGDPFGVDHSCSQAVNIAREARSSWGSARVNSRA